MRGVRYHDLGSATVLSDGKYMCIHGVCVCVCVCVVQGAGWWQHEVCYGKYVKQVHEVRN